MTQGNTFTPPEPAYAFEDGARGRRRWAVAEGWLPGDGDAESPALASHETLCLLNCGDTDASVELVVYFADREPLGPYHVPAPARRTVHVRFDDLTDPEPIPRETDFACVVSADLPIIVQHTRLDTREGAGGLFSTIAFPL